MANEKSVPSIPGLEKGKFERIRRELPRIIYSVQGEPKTAKSTFPLSGPHPQVHLDIDDRLEGVANPWERGSRSHEPKTIVRLPLRIPKVVGWNAKLSDAGVQEAMSKAKSEGMAEWNKFIEHYHMALESSLRPGGVRLISVDDASSLIDLRLISEFGRLSKIPQYARGDANLEIGTLMREGHKYAASVVWVHELKDEYGPVKKVDERGNTVTENEKTGRRILDGYQKTHYAVQVILETSINKKGQFQVEVLRSGLNAKTNRAVYTEDDWGKWGPFAWISSEQLVKTEPEDWVDLKPKSKSKGKDEDED
jgi:hypothetical protein